MRSSSKNVAIALARFTARAARQVFLAGALLFGSAFVLTASSAELAAADRVTDDLFQAIRSGNRNAFETALRRGAKIDGKDEFKNTPLMIAILWDRTRFVTRLLERGAGVNATGGAGQTPLILAAQEGQMATIRLLLGKGARLQQKDSSGENAFSRAVQNNRIDVMGFLLDKGADVNERNVLGFTPVMIAAEQSPEALSFLIKRGGKLQVTGRGGLTPLMLASMRGNTTTVKILLSKGAQPNALDSVGRTALMHAVRHPAVVRLLLQHKARPDLRDSKGENALDHALRREALETVRILRKAKGGPARGPRPGSRPATDGNRLHGGT